MNSKPFSLNLKDVLKGIITAIIGAVITSVTTGLQTGSVDWKTTGTVAGVAGLSYLTKNFLSNQNGDFMQGNK